MNSFDALEAFAKQLDRHITTAYHTKVVLTPSSINEKGVVIKVSLLKSFVQSEPPAARSSRTLRVRVSVAGTAESQTGFKQALETIEALDDYFNKQNLRLEAPIGNGQIRYVPNSRIIQIVSQEDSFIDNPDSIAVQDVQDDRIVIITIPRGGE